MRALRTTTLCIALTFCVMMLLYTVAATVHAQQDETGVVQTFNPNECTTKFCPLSPAPGGSRLADLYSSESLSSFVNKIFVAALSVGAILAVLRLAFAGYLYMTTDAWGQKGKAKEVIGDVVLGLLLLLSIWLILRQINPQILDLDAFRYISQLPKGS